jgi:hypothetical protein
VGNSNTSKIKLQDMRKLLLLSTLFFLNSALFGQDADMRSGIIYGKNHAYSLTAPEGWILDNHSAVNEGLYAVFYKKGESWEKAKTVMYTNTSPFLDTLQNTIDKLIKYDCDNFKKHYKDIKISDGMDIQIKPGISAKVKYLSGESYGNFEAVAYIDAVKTGVMIVLSSRTQEGFTESLTAFESLVKSYFLIADNVEILKE